MLFAQLRALAVENHKMFLNVRQHPVIAQADGLLKGRLNPEMVTLLDGACRIWIPSPAFNTIFVAVHTLHHYGCGKYLIIFYRIAIKRHILFLKFVPLSNNNIKIDKT